MRTPALGGAVFALGLLAAGCTPRGEGPAADAATEIAPGAATLRNEADADLRAMDAEITALEGRTAGLDAEMREDAAGWIAELRAKRDALRADVDRVGTATADDFEDLREDLDDQRADLREDLDEAQLRMATSKAEFETAARRRLDRIDTRIATLGVDSTRGGWNGDLDGVREERREISENLSALAAATEAQFLERRRALADAIADLGRDVAEARNDAADDRRDAATDSTGR